MPRRDDCNERAIAVGSGGTFTIVKIQRIQCLFSTKSASRGSHPGHRAAPAEGTRLFFRRSRPKFVQRAARLRDPPRRACPSEADKRRGKVGARGRPVGFSREQHGEVGPRPGSLERGGAALECRKRLQQLRLGFAEIIPGDIDAAERPQHQAGTEGEAVGPLQPERPRCRLAGEIGIAGEKLGFTQEGIAVLASPFST